MKLLTDQPIIPPPGKFRRWIRSDMRVLRWVFLALYIAIAVGLALLYWREFEDTSLWVILAAMLISQALLIFGTGSIRLCQPFRKRRLILPIIGAATMLTLLVLGVFGSMFELLYLDKVDLPEWSLWGFLAISWIVWSILLWQQLAPRPRFAVLSRLTTYLFTGSLAELLVTVPSHIIVRRRPGCFVGMATMFGILAGLCVMFFSFGPIIFLLFLRPRYRAELGADGHPHCPVCGYDLFATKERCPECGLTVDPTPV
jgi:hypothetical protein